MFGNLHLRIPLKDHINKVLFRRTTTAVRSLRFSIVVNSLTESMIRITMCAFPVVYLPNYFLDQNGNTVAVCRRYTAVKSLFTYPVESLSVGIGVVDKLDTGLTTIPVSSILRKCYSIEHDGALVLIPLCHSD